MKNIYKICFTVSSLFLLALTSCTDDFLERPPYFQVSPTHKAKTWLLDPRAPKVEPPESIKLLRQQWEGV